jgi:hypothetical protein
LTATVDLPTPALAGGDRDHVLHVGQYPFGRPRSGGAGGQLRVEAGVGDHLAHVVGDPRLGRGERRPQRQGDVGRAVPDLDVVDQPQGDDVVAQVRILDRPQALPEFLVVHAPR